MEQATCGNDLCELGDGGVRSGRDHGQEMRVQLDDKGK